MKRYLLGLSVAALVSFSVAACGDSGEDGNSGGAGGASGGSPATGGSPAAGGGGATGGAGGATGGAGGASGGAEASGGDSSLGGMGGTTLVGVCDNPADLAAAGQADVVGDGLACMQTCFLNPDREACISTCMEQATGLSTDCSACTGAYGDCAAQNCVNECIAGVSEACTTCVDQNCGVDLATCAGADLVGL